MDSVAGLYYKNDRLKAYLLLIIAAAVYLPFLNNPLVFDDLTFFHGSVWFYTDSHFDFTFRWLPYSTLGFTWVFFDTAPPVYRVQNLLLHGVNVLLLLLVLRLWISLFVNDPVRQQMSNWGAWLGALVFACHPLAVYATGYIVQRSILMATMFTLLMHLTYFRGLLENNWRYLAMAVAAYFLAVFSKEHSLMAPAILLPMTWVLRDKIRLPRRALLATWLGFILIALIVVLRAKGVLGQVYEKDAPVLLGAENLLNSTPMLHGLSVLTQAGLFFKYLLLMLVPNPAWMSIDMRETFILNATDWTSWIGLSCFVAYGVLAALCLWRGGRVALFGLALLYPWCFFMTEFSTIRIQEIFVLYRTYLWLPGIVLLFPLMLSPLTNRQMMSVGALLTLLLLPLAWNRLWVFADEYRLWDDAVVLLRGKEPMGAQRVYYGRAYAAKLNNNFDRAIDDYKHSLQISSEYPEINLALAEVYVHAGRYPEALAEYDKTILAHPDNAMAHYYKAFLLKRLHENDKARYHLAQSCSLGYNIACFMLETSQEAKRRNKR
jgi:tetratricopeptide (TPR) repeat protein